MEINCRPERQDPPEELLDLALEWGCKISIDTDAHAPGQLEWQAYGCDKAASMGIEADEIVNTWAADDPTAGRAASIRLTAWCMNGSPMHVQCTSTAGIDAPAVQSRRCSRWRYLRRGTGLSLAPAATAPKAPSSSELLRAHQAR